MVIDSRLNDLTQYMSLEPAEDLGCTHLSKRQQDAINVSSAMLPNGKKITMLKTLLTSACERNCNYCPFRSGRDFRRAKLSPDEMAKVLMSMYRSGIVQGIFLSSGVVNGGVKTQDELIATADILRKRYKFGGYIHLKLMPGAEYAQVEQAMRLADRLSLNLEAPNTRRLKLLAPRKVFVEELVKPLQWVQEIRSSKPSHIGWNNRWPSTTSQFVVGAVGENDVELLKTTYYLFKQLRLSRTYFSAFKPVEDTPFEGYPPTPVVRQNRLYQASYLFRDYGFTFEELAFNANGNLPQQVDPKTAWALKYLAGNPIEMNNARYQDLLRVPGIGPKSAKAIIHARKKGRLRFLEDLRKIGVNPTRSIPFVLLDGRSPGHQLTLWQVSSKLRN
jgi:predicted DNA-binding helix-hairpin-helix protein